MITLKTISVITAFEIDVTTTIHDGKRAFVSRKLFASSETMPALVPSEKKSQRNRPMMRLSL